MSNNTSTKLSENTASALSYVLGPISGLIFLVIERENKTVRFHAMQSFIFFGIAAVLKILLGFICGLPLIGFVAGAAMWLLSVITLVAYIYLIATSYQGKQFKIPFIGESAWAQVNK